MIAESIAPVEAPASAYHVVQVRPPGYVHAAALTELAETVYYGLLRLGLKAHYEEPPRGPARQIVIGAHLLDAEDAARLPPDAIVYNSEQIDPDSGWLKGVYSRVLRTRTVWDYSAENVRRLAAAGAREVRLVPLGHVPELCRIAPGAEDIDVLFYGSINPRRHAVIEALRACGLSVEVLFGVFGEERDRAISRAKVVLNVHYYEAKIFEVVRVSYLLTNGKAVVAEVEPETSIEPELRAAVCGVPFARLINACQELVRDPAKRRAQGDRGQALFASRSEAAFLAEALGLAPPVAWAAKSLPSTLHVGSGKDFNPAHFNVDIEPNWAPDAVLDMAAKDLVGRTVETARFGAQRLGEGSFDTVVALEVLEHIPDLPTAMTNCLRLLRPGGLMHVSVPYDLSTGAWQDPTHVRAFNEQSWRYYTDWHWYLGWTEQCFDLVYLEFLRSPYGETLEKAGRNLEELTRVPRAIDGMRVILRKRYLQPSERAEARRRQPQSRTAAGG